LTPLGVPSPALFAVLLVSSRRSRSAWRPTAIVMLLVTPAIARLADRALP
jgi:hypothetical protein